MTAEKKRKGKWAKSILIGATWGLMAEMAHYVDLANKE